MIAFNQRSETYESTAGAKFLSYMYQMGAAERERDSDYLKNTISLPLRTAFEKIKMAPQLNNVLQKIFSELPVFVMHTPNYFFSNVVDKGSYEVRLISIL